MGTRKNSKSKKSNKGFRRTRSKRQRGGGLREIDTKLFDAVTDNDLDGIAEALRRGANVNAMDQYGNTALGWAEHWRRSLSSAHSDATPPHKLISSRGKKQALSDEAQVAFNMVKVLLDAGAHAIEIYDPDPWDPEYTNFLKTYIKKQVPIMTEEEFARCEKSDENKVECGMSLEELNRFQAVNPISDPPDNNNVCFKRSFLQRWLKQKVVNHETGEEYTRYTNPVNNANIDKNWIWKWYPLGLQENYDDNMMEMEMEMDDDDDGMMEIDAGIGNLNVGGKRKTRKQKSKKSKRKTRKNKRKTRK